MGNKEYAQDCIQEVFIKVYNKLDNFNEKSKFSTWLYRVTVNTAIDLQRKHNKHSNDLSEDFDSYICDNAQNPEKSVWLDSINQTTQRALLQLSEEIRLAFILRHHEERTIEEISQILEINPNTVKNRIYRAVARLREILQAGAGEYE